MALVTHDMTCALDFAKQPAFTASQKGHETVRNSETRLKMREDSRLKERNGVGKLKTLRKKKRVD